MHNGLIKEILLKLKGLNKTIIISSHIFATLNETCDYLHHLKNGKIVRTAEKFEFDKVENDMKKTGIVAILEKLNVRIREM